MPGPPEGLPESPEGPPDSLEGPPDPLEGLLDPAKALPDPLQLAYRYLNGRDRTEDEVRRHLAAKGVDAAAVQEAIETLRDHGYVDDARYARLFAEDKRALEGWGTERIKGTLALRGIDRDLIDDAVAADGGAGAEMDRALEILRRRFPSPPRERRDRDRALAVLLRKGYDPDLALDALTVHARAD
ncbi:MAG: regulatory protein RecX [Solirubrobacteraceae bacterium]